MTEAADRLTADPGTRRWMGPASLDLRTDASHASCVAETRYAKSGDVYVAYQVLGEGSLDLVFVAGAFTHLDVLWEEPHYRRFCEQLASSYRLILFDKRGMGLSDRVRIGTLGERMDDIRAVMDAAESERALLLGVSEGGPLAMLFAEAYPERTRALLLVGAEVREETDRDWAWGVGRTSTREAAIADAVRRWDQGGDLERFAPSLASDESSQSWWRRLMTNSATPGTAEAFLRMAFEIDVRHVLPSISVPTLVVQRVDDRICSVQNGRYLAANIGGAEYVELPGSDHLPWVDGDDIVATIRRFVATRVAPGVTPAAAPLETPEGRLIDDAEHAGDTLNMRALALFGEGVVAAAEGQAEDACRLLGRAAQLWTEARRPLRAGQARLELARILASLGLLARADTEARRALADFRAVGAGAGADADRTAELLRSLNVPRAVRGSVRATELSEREREVLRLVAEGWSNDEIASLLSLSPHTVHRHVANILDKLDVASRAAAVAEGARRGLI